MPGGAMLHRRRGENFKIRRRREARDEVFSIVCTVAWAIFLRRPRNGTGPIGEGERLGGFAEHISGSHEIRFYGRRASGNELVAG